MSLKSHYQVSTLGKVGSGKMKDSSDKMKVGSGKYRLEVKVGKVKCGLAGYDFLL